MEVLGGRESEEERILDRLARFEKIHVSRPSGQQAVANLKRQGKVAYHWDGGVAGGMMIVYLPHRAPAAAPQGGGGDVA